MNYQRKAGIFWGQLPLKLKLLFIPCAQNNFSPRFLVSNLLLCTVLAVLVLKIILVGLYVPFPRNIFFADITKIDLVNLLNKDRQSFGLEVLNENEDLNKAAALKAKDMVAKGYFAHNSPEGVNPWYWFSVAGYKYHYAGENLAVGFMDSPRVFEAWAASPSHNANMVNPNFKEVGTAVLEGFGNSNAIVVVQMFGSRLNTVNKTALANNSEPVKKEEFEIEVLEPEDQITKEQPRNRVLAQSTETIMPLPEQQGKSTAYLKFLNFVVYSNGRLLQYAIYGLLAVVFTSLALNVLINFQVQRPQVIFRALVLMAILCTGIFFNENVMFYVLPYQITI